MFLVSHKGQKTNIPKAVKSLFKTWRPSHSITIKTLVWKDPVLVVQDARVIDSLQMSPKSIRGDLGLRVWVLGIVEESIVLSEAKHAE